MKKKVMFFYTMILVLSTIVPIHASQNPMLTNLEEVDIANITSVRVEILNQNIIRLSNQVNGLSLFALPPGVTELETIALPTHYNQNDYNVKLGVCPDLTIRSAGCALTALAIVRDYLKGSPYKDPVALNNSFMIPNNLCGMNWDKAATSLGMTYLSAQSISIQGLSADTVKMKSFFNNVRTNVKSSRPVIFEVGFDFQGKEPHFFIATGYLLADDGTFVIYVENPGATYFRDLEAVFNDGRWNAIKHTRVYFA